MIRQLLTDMFNQKGRRIRAMGTNTVTTRGRTTTAVVAATLTLILAVDPFGMSQMIASADPPGDGDLSRAQRVDAVVDGLDLETAVEATTLTGSWSPLPGAGGLDAAATDLPTEDEQIVVLTSEGGGGAASYLASFTVDPDPTAVDLGGMAVAVAEAAPEVTPDAVKLRVAGETETEAAGITGVLLEVTDASGDAVADPEVELTVSYADFAGLVGGDWASRLRIMWIPDCETPVIDCRPVPLETVNDLAAQTVTATVPVGEGVQPVSYALRKPGAAPASAAAGEGGGGSLAVSAGASGSGGNWGATSLSASATWAAGGSTGGFTWSLPFKTPTAAAGPAPDLGLSYSSAASDGRTPNSNNQSGLVGEGFSVTSSYVERSYVPCSQDEEGAANNVDRVSGDQCWGTENATLSFNGSAVELVHDVATNTWHGKNEDGSLIERLTGAWNGGQANEYWKVTTTDGTQYFFGRGQRSADDTTSLNSAWTVPVYGNHSGEPCYNSDFSDARCNQVWRWNLEYVVDPSGNSMTYFYSKETNSYVYDIEGNLDGNIVSYTSGGRLDRIEYGTRAGSESTGSAPAKVTLTTSPRCITDLATPDSWCSSTQTSTSSNKWLDTPVDLICSAEPCTNYTPVFFDRYRLNDVSTFGYDGTDYQPVDSWSLQQRFVASGTGGLEYAATPMLITTGVTHTGKGGTATTTDDLPLSPHQFGYAYLDNRVDSTADGVDPLRRPRISDIRTEAGASVTVNYRTECSSTDKPGTSAAAQEANTKLCYPVKWAESDYADAVVEYFHKYVVETIVEAGSPPAGATLVTGSVAKQTGYTYVGGAAWAKPTGAMVKPDEVTFSDFRGFGEVITTVGLGLESSSTKSVYYRGMGGTITGGPASHTVTADDLLGREGQVFEEITLDGEIVLSESITVPGDPVITATDAKGNTASRVPSSESFGFSYDAAGALEFRTGTKTTYDADSQTISVENLGDRTDAADNLCTTLTYAHTADANLASKHLLSQVSRTDGVAGSCGSTPNLPEDLISSATTTFDSVGRPLKSYAIDATDGEGYVLTGEVLEYDIRGRPLRTTDSFGNVSTVSYQESLGGLPQSTTSTTPDPDGTGPLVGFTSTNTFNPLTGSPLSTIDLNGRVTSGTYDALGRLLTVRYPQHQAYAGHPATVKPSVQYEYFTQSNGLNSIVTKTLGADGTTQHISVALHDGMLRPFQNQIEGKDAGADHNADEAARGRLVSSFYYDSAGRIAKQTGLWWAEGMPQTTPVVPIAVPPSTTTFLYDGAGRQTAEIFWVGNDSDPANEKWRTLTDYNGAATLQVPPMGGTPKAVVTDALGRTVELIEYLRDPDLRADADLPSEVLALDHQSTTYTFDVAGRITEMYDPAGNEWSFEYDWAGRQTSATDPDAGTSTTLYNIPGQVVAHTDANGETLAYTYDALGRKTSVRDDSPTGAVRVQWQFDQSTDSENNPLLGQLSSATRYVDGEPYTTSIPRYDEAYTPLRTEVSLPNIPAFAALDSRIFATDYTYAADGQAASVTLPAVKSGGITRLGRETVTTRFDTASAPSWMSGGFGWGTYVAESRVRADGRPLLADLGNTYGAITSYEYEEGTNRLVGVSLDREGFDGTDVDLHYGYDAAGNLTSMSDRPTNFSAPESQDNQCFGFDGLNRLELAFTALGGDCAVAQGGVQIGEVGGVQPYWSEYQYDELSNRTKLIEHGLDGAPTTTTDYEHGTSTAGPHQLTSLTKTTGSSPTTTEFSYDDAGNRVSAAGSALTWDAEGELTAVDDEEYIYDAEGSRLVRFDASGTTVYLPGGQEVHIGASTVTASRYYSFGGATVATRTGSGLGAVTSLVSDRHGSTVAAVPNTQWTTTSVARVFSDPFGATRGGSDEDLPGDHRFLGAIRDSGSGLTLLGARYYDEAVGQFISVDPLLDKAVPAQFNAYSYSFNNPVSFSDPSGMDPKEHQIAKTAKPAKKWPILCYDPSGCRPPTDGDRLVEDVADAVLDGSGYTDYIQGQGGQFIGMDHNADGTYTSQYDAAQWVLGYRDDFDTLFKAVSEMDKVKVTFEYDGWRYVVWAWKGDYGQLGAGTEIGFYRQPAAFFTEEGQFFADPWGYNPKMGVSLSLRGPGEIASYAPEDPQFWPAVFNPAYQDVHKGDLTATHTVDFSGAPDGMDGAGFYAAFEDAVAKSDDLGHVTFGWDPKNSSVTFKFRKRRRSSVTTLRFRTERGSR